MHLQTYNDENRLRVFIYLLLALRLKPFSILLIDIKTTLNNFDLQKCPTAILKRLQATCMSHIYETFDNIEHSKSILVS